MKRVIAALNCPRRINDFIFYAKGVADNLVHDPVFTPKPRFLADFQARVGTLETASVAALSRERGLAAACKCAKARVLGDLLQVRNYVQTVAEANPGSEASVIQRAGLDVKDAKGPSKPPFAAKNGRVAGAVHLYARAAKTRASYEWQYSLDGERWESGPDTVRADVVLSGLASATLYYFRYRCLTRNGPSDWCDPVVLLVG